MKMFVLLERRDFEGTMGAGTTTCQATSVTAAESIEEAARKLEGCLHSEQREAEGQRFLKKVGEQSTSFDESTLWLKEVTVVQ